MPTYPDCSYVSAADTSEPTGASYIYCLAAEVRELKRAVADVNGVGGTFLMLEPFTACDPYWDNVVLAMHMDGANNATDAIDEKGAIVNFNGGAKLSTAEFKYGTSSLTSPDSNGSVEVEVDVIGALDGVDGKITFWFYGVSNGTYQYIFSTENTGGAIYSISAALLASGVIEVYIGSPDENNKVDITGTVNVVGAWHFVQITKVGADWTMHIDGTLDGSVSASSSAVWGGSTTIALISRYNIQDRLFPSYLDDFKITVGTFSDFTPPTAPFYSVACL